VQSKQLWQALSAGVAIVALATPASAQVRAFNIQAGSLKSALDAYARQSGRQVIYRTDEVRGVQSPGATGSLTAEGALDALLARTGFSYRVDGSGAVAIVRSPEHASLPLDQSAPAAVASTAASGSIVVTGSRVHRPNDESPTPIVSVRGEEFFQTGRTAIGETLNDLPSMRSTVSQSNSTRIGGGAGLNMLDLRGLGIDRTLVLQNGRRHIPGGPFTTAVDVDTIPTDLIDRVDIVTGGSSAVYGSDAIAGVVNFILKRDYDGIQLRGQDGISRHGDAGQQYLSALAGKNFAGGRGNIAANFEYSHQDDWYESDRPAYRNLAFYLQTDFDEPGAPNGSDGIPDRTLFRDIRYIGFSNGGQYIVFEPGPDGNVPAYNFQPDGTLALQTGDRVGLPPFAFYNGGNGSNLLEGKQIGLSPDVRRYNFNVLGHFTVSDAFEPFIEAKYVRVDAFGSSLGSFFSAGLWGPREVYSTDNPFLTEQARDFIKQTLGLGPGEDSPFYFGRNFADLGPLVQNNRRETYRIVGGVRGTFNGDWTYELSANAARVKSRTTDPGNVNIQRFLLAIDAVRDPVTGEIVCRSKIDPTAAVAYEFANNPEFAQAELAQDVAQCSPLNPFGEGNVSQAAKDYIFAQTESRARITQFVLNGYLTGDSSQWFELPGGPVGFVVGGEYRRETFRDVQDALLQSGITFNTGEPPFEPPSFAVKELFGELRVPILAKRPFFDELTLNAAGRVADYKGKTGTVFAWNAGAEWAPVHDLRFRVNQSRAVRAPNLVEIYQPLGQSFVNEGLTEDPCALHNIGAGSSNREANCRAAGVPAGYDFTYISSFPYLSGGNPDLRAETSDSLTIGAVAQPRFVPGLSLSVDYYDIKVKDVITTPSVQAILNSCYDAANIENQFCALFQRNLTGSTLPTGEIPGQIIDNSLRLVPLNYAALKVRGIDLEAHYRRNLPGFALLDTRLIYTRALQNDSFLNPEDPHRADQNLLELGNPKDAFNWDLNLKRGPVTLGYRMRYIGKMTPGAIENIVSVQGRPPEDEDAYPIRYFQPAWYHNIRLGFDLSRYDFYVGVDNLTDRLPPPSVNGVSD